MTDSPATVFEGGETYRQIVAQLQDAVVVADKDEYIRVWNRGAEILFGFSAQEAIGARLDLIVPERFWPSHDKGFRRAIAAGQLKTEGRILTTRANHKYGCRLYVDFSFSLLRSAGGELLGVIAVGRDVTAKHLEGVAAKVADRQP